MAKVDIKVPDDFLLKISKLGSDFDPVAEKVLKAGLNDNQLEVLEWLQAYADKDTGDKPMHQFNSEKRRV